MVLGAGEMAELALECLAGEGVRTSVVASRTFDRARSIADHYGATAMRFEDCWPLLAEVDLLLCSTASPHAIVTIDHVRPTLLSRGDRPLCILDIALPRDVEREVGELDNVYLYDLDDLQSLIASSLERRRDHVPVAEGIIAAEVERFWEWLAGLEAVPVLTEFRSAMDRVRVRELEDAMRRLADLTPEQRQAVEHLTRSLMNKFLHEPTVRLRSAAANGRGLAVVDAARYLFGLQPPRPGEAALEDVAASPPLSTTDPEID
jgi:glutamyl-tRNA reductase